MKHEIVNPYEIGLAERRFDSTRPGQRIARRLYSAWLRYRRWRIASEAIRHLESLEDHRLDDIGIPRPDIASAVHGRLAQRGKSAAAGPPRRKATACDSLAA